MNHGLPQNLAMLGAGNLGQAIVQGLLDHARMPAARLIMTRHRTGLLTSFVDQGVTVLSDNAKAVVQSRIIVLSVKPFKVEEVAREIMPVLKPDQIIISVATGVSIGNIREWTSNKVPVFRAMPNTAIGIGESLTCIARDNFSNDEAFKEIETLFNQVGRAVEITEDLMNAATVLGACGVAYALRFIRAMVQGGIEIGFDASTAALIANQTVRGAATLLLQGNAHPEAEIDKVTTPKGCTIAGLNEMEHQGFSSSLIKGITTSFDKIG
jgi:pyrroline-5-carboxylate reductase